MKRVFDVFASLLGMLFLIPVGVPIALLIWLEDRGPVFFSQIRVGKGGVDFRLLKFRTMRIQAEKEGQITVGGRDSRITRIGYFLRKYKVDELPQLLNILRGDMSFVGPRPEVPRYVALYTPDQRAVLNVRPGLTDYASVEFIDENEILGHAEDAEKCYVEEILPKKLALQLKYIENMSMAEDLRILFRTARRIVR